MIPCRYWCAVCSLLPYGLLLRSNIRYGALIGMCNTSFIWAEGAHGRVRRPSDRAEPA